MDGCCACRSEATKVGHTRLIAVGLALTSEGQSPERALRGAAPLDGVAEDARIAAEARGRLSPVIHPKGGRVSAPAARVGRCELRVIIPFGI